MSCVFYGIYCLFYILAQVSHENKDSDLKKSFLKNQIFQYLDVIFFQFPSNYFPRPTIF